MPESLLYAARSSEYYKEQWRLYYEERHRRAKRLGLLLGGFAALGLLIASMPDTFQSNHPSCVVIAVVSEAIVWVLAAVNLFTFNWMMGGLDCPRCGELFFASAFIRNPFGKHCRHCGLKRLTKSDLSLSNQQLATRKEPHAHVRAKGQSLFAQHVWRHCRTGQAEGVNFSLKTKPI